jgi:hypothetical protein
MLELALPNKMIQRGSERDANKEALVDGDVGGILVGG